MTASRGFSPDSIDSMFSAAEGSNLPVLVGPGAGSNVPDSPVSPDSEESDHGHPAKRSLVPVASAARMMRSRS